MKLTNLNFHQTFPPDVYMLSLLITSDVYDRPLSKEEISQMTGIPTGKSSGKVEPDIAYAKYMGLLNDNLVDGKHLLSLTPLGEKILAEDPGIREEITVLVCYLRMTSIFGGAPLWETIMSELLYKDSRGISNATIEEFLQKESTAKINFGPFYSSFADGAFSSLGLLERSASSIRLIKQSYNADFVFAYAYILFREWELTYPQRDELTANEIEGLYAFHSIGWKEREVYSALECFHEKGLVRFNRQLTPYTIIKLDSSENLISKLYDELC